MLGLMRFHDFLKIRLTFKKTLKSTGKWSDIKKHRWYNKWYSTKFACIFVGFNQIYVSTLQTEPREGPTRIMVEHRHTVSRCPSVSTKFIAQVLLILNTFLSPIGIKSMLIFQLFLFDGLFYDFCHTRCWAGVYTYIKYHMYQ